MKIKNYVWLLAIALIACESDDEETVDFGGLDPEKGYVVVGNQGNFLSNDASITIYDLESDEATQGVFAAANNDEALGDVLQSIYHYNDEVYVVMNNSSKVEVLNDSTFERARTIVGLASPRFMHFLSDEKAYISENNFGPTGNKINIVNPLNGTYLGAINTEFSIENMMEVNGEIWCTSTTAGKVVIVDPATDAIIDEIAVGPNATDIALDANGNIWVLCQGQGAWAGQELEPSLYRIDPETNSVETSFDFPAGTGFGGFMQISADQEELLILMLGEVLKMDVDATTLPSDAFIALTGQSIYGVSVNPSNGDIVVTDAGGLTSSGGVFIYTKNGVLKDTFDGGIAPWMAFWN